MKAEGVEGKAESTVSRKRRDDAGQCCAAEVALVSRGDENPESGEKRDTTRHDKTRRDTIRNRERETFQIDDNIDKQSRH